MQCGELPLAVHRIDLVSRLIESQRGRANRAPIVVWPYPIEPAPGGPLPAEYDVLLYEKSGVDPRLTALLARTWPRHARVCYAHYDRERLYDLARRSKCCVYFSDDDRGPLALAEILLTGCPVVGVPRAHPLSRVDGLAWYCRVSRRTVCAAVQCCQQMDRHLVATVAACSSTAGRLWPASRPRCANYRRR